MAARAGVEARRPVFRVPLQQRTAGRQHHFERAGDAGAIAGHQARRRDRVAPFQFGMQRGDAFAGEPRPHRLAHLGRNRRHRGDALRQRLEIKTGAADDDRARP